MVFSSFLLQKLWNFIDKESYLLAIADRNVGVCRAPLSLDAAVVICVWNYRNEHWFILVKNQKKSKDLGYLEKTSF